MTTRKIWRKKTTTTEQAQNIKSYETIGNGIKMYYWSFRREERERNINRRSDND